MWQNAPQLRSFTMTWMRLSGGLLACLLLAGSGRGADQPPKAKFNCAFDKPGDGVVAGLDDDTASFRILSKTGIGGAKITLTQGAWPKQVVIRLELGSLEAFSASNGPITLKGALGRAGGKVGEVATLHFSAKGEPLADGNKAVYTLTIRRVAEGLIEVQLPSKLVAMLASGLRLTWIDAYRR